MDIKVGADGRAMKGLKKGDRVVTAAGTYTITGVNVDGSYKVSTPNTGVTTENYRGTYGIQDSGRDMSDDYAADTAAQKKYAARQSERTAQSLERASADTGAFADKASSELYKNYLSSLDGTETESSQIAGRAAFGEGEGKISSARTAALSELDAAKKQSESALSEYGSRLDAQEDKLQAQLEAYRLEKDAKDAEEAKEYAFTLLKKGVCSPEIASAAGLSQEEAEAYCESSTGAKAKRREQLTELIRETGYTPTFKECEQAGLLYAEAQSLAKRHGVSAAEKSAKKTSSGKSSSSASEGKLNYGEMRYSLSESEDPLILFFDYAEKGWITGKANYDTLYDYALQRTIETPPTDYKTAARVLKICAVPTTQSSRLMTENEWERRRETGHTAAGRYSSYGSYCAAFVRSLIMPMD